MYICRCKCLSYTCSHVHTLYNITCAYCTCTYMYMYSMHIVKIIIYLLCIFHLFVTLRSCYSQSQKKKTPGYPIARNQNLFYHKFWNIGNGNKCFHYGNNKLKGLVPATDWTHMHKICLPSRMIQDNYRKGMSL